MDYNFADCSVPQEKSNAEINVELEISDASGEEDENDGRRNYKQLEYSRPTGLYAFFLLLSAFFYWG